MHPILKIIPQFIYCTNYARVVGSNAVISRWEYIRLFMGDDESLAHLKKIRKKEYVPVLPWNNWLMRNYLSPPHRWPPEIEALLLPENKDAPLPKGWAYDTWIPCAMPRRGFDNTTWLRERELRLKESANSACQ
jgi:hypothetical protein